jgi:hypothetical protein
VTGELDLCGGVRKNPETFPSSAQGKRRLTHRQEDFERQMFCITKLNEHVSPHLSTMTSPFRILGFLYSDSVH